MRRDRSMTNNGDQDAHHQAQLGILLGLSAYLFWGLATIYWKQLRDFDAFELIGWRVATSTVLLVTYMGARHRVGVLITALRNVQVFLRILLASILLTINWSTYVWAVVNGHILETALGYFIAPLFTMIIGIVVLREKLRKLQKVAVSFAGAGVAVLTVMFGTVPWLALIIAASWSTYGFLKKQISLSPIESLTGELIVVCLPAIVYTLICWNRTSSVQATADSTEWILVLLLGVVTTAPLLLFAGSAQRIPLTLIGPMQYIVPTINFVLGWLVYKEEFSLGRFAGFALIWVCLALVLIDLVTSQQRVARYQPQSS